MKKHIYVINMALTLTVILFSAAIIVSVVVARFSGKTPDIFDYTFHFVLTPSMEPEIKAGDFVVAKKAGISEAKTGDYVIFVSPDPELRGMTIIHSVADAGTDAEGKYLITSGIKEGTAPDAYPVREIIGIYRWKSTFLGRIFSFLSNLRNIVFAAVIIGALAVAAKYTVKIVEEVKKKKVSRDNEEK